MSTRESASERDRRWLATPVSEFTTAELHEQLRARDRRVRIRAELEWGRREANGRIRRVTESGPPIVRGVPTPDWQIAAWKAASKQ